MCKHLIIAVIRILSSAQYMVLNLIGNYIADKVTELVFSASLELLGITFKFICKGCSKFTHCICCCCKRRAQTLDSNSTQLQFHCVFCGSKDHSLEQCHIIKSIPLSAIHYPDIEPPTPSNFPSSSSSSASSSTAAVATLTRRPATRGAAGTAL